MCMLNQGAHIWELPYTTITLNDKTVKALMDSGAAASTIHVQMLTEEQKNKIIKPTGEEEATMRTFTDELVRPLGFLPMGLMIAGYIFRIDVMIVETCRESCIIGFDVIKELERRNIQWINVKRMTDKEVLEEKKRVWQRADRENRLQDTSDDMVLIGDPFTQTNKTCTLLPLIPTTMSQEEEMEIEIEELHEMTSILTYNQVQLQSEQPFEPEQNNKPYLPDIERMINEHFVTDKEQSKAITEMKRQIQELNLSIVEQSDSLWQKAKQCPLTHPSIKLDRQMKRRIKFVMEDLSLRLYLFPRDMLGHNLDSYEMTAIQLANTGDVISQPTRSQVALEPEEKRMLERYWKEQSREIAKTDDLNNQIRKSKSEWKAAYENEEDINYEIKQMNQIACALRMIQYTMGNEFSYEWDNYGEFINKILEGPYSFTDKLLILQQTQRELQLLILDRVNLSNNLMFQADQCPLSHCLPREVREWQDKVIVKLDDGKLSYDLFEPRNILQNELPRIVYKDLDNSEYTRHNVIKELQELANKAIYTDLRFAYGNTKKEKVRLYDIRKRIEETCNDIGEETWVIIQIRQQLVDIINRNQGKRGMSIPRNNSNTYPYVMVAIKYPSPENEEVHVYIRPRPQLTTSKETISDETDTSDIENWGASSGEYGEVTTNDSPKPQLNYPMPPIPLQYETKEVYLKLIEDKEQEISRQKYLLEEKEGQLRYAIRHIGNQEKRLTEMRRDLEEYKARRNRDNNTFTTSNFMNAYDDDLMRVCIQFGGQIVNAVIDTGSTTTLAHPRIIDTPISPVTKQKRKAITIDGREIEDELITRTTIKILGETLNLMIVVRRTLPYDCIIGMDIIRLLRFKGIKWSKLLSSNYDNISSSSSDSDSSSESDSYRVVGLEDKGTQTFKRIREPVITAEKVTHNASTQTDKDYLLAAQRKWNRKELDEKLQQIKRLLNPSSADESTPKKQARVMNQGSSYESTPEKEAPLKLEGLLTCLKCGELFTTHMKMQYHWAMKHPTETAQRLEIKNHSKSEISRKEIPSKSTSPNWTTYFTLLLILCFITAIGADDIKTRECSVTQFEREDNFASHVSDSKYEHRAYDLIYTSFDEVYYTQPAINGYFSPDNNEIYLRPGPTYIIIMRPNAYQELYGYLWKHPEKFHEFDITCPERRASQFVRLRINKMIICCYLEPSTYYEIPIKTYIKLPKMDLKFIRENVLKVSTLAARPITEHIQHLQEEIEKLIKPIEEQVQYFQRQIKKFQNMITTSSVNPTVTTLKPILLIQVCCD